MHDICSWRACVRNGDAEHVLSFPTRLLQTRNFVNFQPIQEEIPFPRRIKIRKNHGGIFVKTRMNINNFKRREVDREEEKYLYGGSRHENTIRKATMFQRGWIATVGGRRVEIMFRDTANSLHRSSNPVSIRTRRTVIGRPPRIANNHCQPMRVVADQRDETLRVPLTYRITVSISNYTPS